MHLIKRLSLTHLALILAFFGMILLGHPPLPDTHFGTLEKTGTLLIEFFFVIQTFRWGDWFLRRILPSLQESNQIAHFSFSLPIGAAFLATLGTFLGLSGLIGPTFSSMYWFILFMPCFFSSPNFKLPNQKASMLTKVLLLVLFIGMLAYVIDSFELKSHGDVFNYHLPPTRLWYDAGKIKVVESFISAHQAGLWDSFHLWVVEMLSGPLGRGLVPVQHAAQWSQILIAYGGSLLVLIVMFFSMGFELELSLLGAFAGLCVNQMNPSFAKNDWGSTFWILSGVALAEWANTQTWPSKKRALILAGICIGCGVTSKWTTLFFVLPWGAFQLFSLSVTSVALLAVSVLIGAAPICLRNWFQVGNPIFPTFNLFFKSPYVVPSLQLDLSKFHSEHFSVTIEKLSSLFWQTVNDVPFSVLGPLMLLLVFAIPAQRRKNLALIGLTVAAGCVLFIGNMTSYVQGRLAGPLLVFWAAFTFLTLALLLNSRWKKWNYNNWLLATGITLVLAAFSHFPIYAFKQAFFYKPSNQKIREFTSGDYKYWIRNHLPSGAQILSCDNEFYYLLGYRIRSFPDLMELKQTLTGMKPHLDEPEWLFDELASENTEFIVLGRNNPQMMNVSIWVNQRWPKAIIYKDASVIIVDVKQTDVSS